MDALIYKRKWPAFLFLLPALLFLLVFLYYPFFRNIADSFFSMSRSWERLLTSLSARRIT